MANYLSEVYGKGGIYAKCVAASIANGIPVYTLETKAPKFIDAEFEKHRMLSSNSSSSRALPFKKLDEIYVPFDVRKNQGGMQGYEEVHPRLKDDLLYKIKNFYEYIMGGFKYTDLDKHIHKQHINRYLEPWMFQKKVVTATEWDNFFNLRLAPEAQPEIFELAKCMKEAMERVTPAVLKPGEWHLPYVSGKETNDVFDIENNIWEYPLLCLDEQIKCSVARCARVSYMNHDNTEPDIEKDLGLHERLLSSGHWSAFEHQLTPMPNKVEMYPNWSKGITHVDKQGRYWSGNMHGWIQNRQLLQEWN